MSSYMYLDLNNKEHPPISAHRGLMLGGAELCPLDWLFLPATRKPVLAFKSRAGRTGYAVASVLWQSFRAWEEEYVNCC